MELTQLYQFKAIAECNQITKAAERLFVSPPALCKSLKKLELELGYELFDRQKKSLVLNSVGKTVLEDVNGIFILVDKIKNETMKAATNLKEIKIASSLPASIRYLMPRFNAQYPEIGIYSSFKEKQELITDFMNNEIDIVIMDTPIERKDICVIPFCEERIMVCVPQGNPLSELKELYIEELEGQTLVRFTERSHFLLLLDSICNEFDIHIDFRYQSDYMIYHAMLPSSNYLFLTSNIAMQYTDIPNEKKCVPIADESFCVRYYVMYNTNNSKTAHPFIKWLTDNYEALLL